MTSVEDRITAAWDLVENNELQAAYELCEREPIREPPAAASSDERMRGCLAIRIGRFGTGFDLLERNRLSRVKARKATRPYRTTGGGSQLDRATRGLYDCLVAGIMPAVFFNQNLYASASTLAYVRVIGWVLGKAKRRDESAIVLAAYERWLDASLAASDSPDKVVNELREYLGLWKDRVGVRQLDKRV